MLRQLFQKYPINPNDCGSTFETCPLRKLVENIWHPPLVPVTSTSVIFHLHVLRKVPKIQLEAFIRVWDNEYLGRLVGCPGSQSYYQNAFTRALQYAEVQV